ncbi:MAG: molybdopterin-dependent oxidoreductase [Dehalococcoidia bacterium]|nr:molybdopterin-dependent oxidoreductase [Dehalococcoidia bacterium]
MVQITINDHTVEAEPGRRLVEVIKEQGITITNLCYIDGLEPYAGCRTCIVEIEGARPTPLQLSCVAQVTEGMVVRTHTEEAKRTRQSVMSIIMANHPDRCLSCHRRVHCMPGDICLRDDVVTHRCLTCSKNYRCELQTSCENLDQGEFEEPWVGEARSYYETPPPEPDRGNPFLEFDPQMCIICTRCVRACDDLRHTGAITLSGKGHTTMIAFGTGGQVHESDCDFCGACIDVCPTATLMEKPNKWVGKADDWTNSVCNSCSVGCTISYGLNDDFGPTIVRPDRVNPASRDQICVRGRFHYDAIPDKQRLSRALVRAGDRLLPASSEDALARAVEAVSAVKQAAGAGAVAVLGSPMATNEESFVLAALARAIGTPHVDFASGAVHRAVSQALEGAFGTDRLPASLADLERSDTIVTIARDLEESHQVVALRIRDAVVKRKAKLVRISPMWSEMDGFSHAVIRVQPGHEAAVTQALVDGAAAPDGVDAAQWQAALDALAAAQADAESLATVVYAPNNQDVALAGEGAKAAANLAIALRGQAAPDHLLYMPTEANVRGATDAGIAPGPGGKSFAEIVAAAQAGEVRAVVLHGDNPLLTAPGGPAIAAALANLEALVVVDEVRSTAAEHATVVLPMAPFFASSGTLTNADLHVFRHNAAPKGKAPSGLSVLQALAQGLGASVAFESPAAVTEALAAEVPGYPTNAMLGAAPGGTRVVGSPSRASAQAVAPAPASPRGEGSRGEGELTLITGRSLYHSWEGSSIRSEEADKLHREEQAWINPRDAEAARIRTGDVIDLVGEAGTVHIAARLDDGVPPGTVYVPLYFDAGAVLALYPLDGQAAGAPAVRLRALQPA